MVQRKSTTEETTIYKTPYRKLKIEPHERAVNFCYLYIRYIDIVYIHVYIYKSSCNMNAFFTFDFFMVYIPECKQQL